jgi:predicted ribosomally synthesized peptide with SipW-like signal peptide
MKRILIAIMTLVVVLGLAGTGAFAFLGDKETATGNSYTAGTINLTVGAQDDPNVQHIVMDPIAPHKADYTYQDFNKQWVVKNEGNLPGTFWAEIKNIVNNENGIIEPEANAGDTTASAGELGDLTWVQFSRNQAPWGSLSPKFKPFNTALDVPTTPVVLQPGESLNFYMWFDWPTSGLTDFYGVDNTAQGDSLTFDVVFHLEQIVP